MNLLFLFSALFCSNVFGHIQMRDPPPRRSKYSTYYTSSGLVDYNLMAPINSGYSFPCKGYTSGPSTKFIIGNTITISLEGSTIHGGGHCQFGISTDDQTFIVMKTIIRDCLLTSMSYSFSIPNLPKTKLTVFWTWINAIGNREYYMDCADVDVGSNDSQTSIITGKSLLVMNLPGYPTLPEFPNRGMYDGREYFNDVQDISISIGSSPESTPRFVPVPQPTPRFVPVPQPTPRFVPAPQPTPRFDPAPQPIDCSCQHGEMKCGGGGGFDTCVYGNFIWRPCAPGTKCKVNGESIICT